MALEASKGIVKLIFMVDHENVNNVSLTDNFSAHRVMMPAAHIVQVWDRPEFRQAFLLNSPWFASCG